MKRIFFIALTIAACAVVLNSCRVARTVSVVPQAMNTINSVNLSELNLDRKDYTILKTISAEATLTAHFSENVIAVADPNDEFSLSWKKTETGWTPDKVKGVLRLGYLDNDYKNELFEVDPYPHWIVRRLAMYRLINAAKVAGGDGVIEPIISTSVEQGRGRNDIIYKTTVSAKLIKIKPDGK